MAASNRALQIGVIAEEHNDVEVLEELASKVIKKNGFSISRFVGHGCGKLRNKCGVWARNLRDRGCDLLIVAHDLDRNDEAALRDLLSTSTDGSGFKYALILIPIEELEAWLLCDAEALRTVFNMRSTPKVSKAPETIKSPKEFLGQLVRGNSKTQYLNTVHNKRIAGSMNLETLARCPSFGDFPKFLRPRFARNLRVT